MSIFHGAYNNSPIQSVSGKHYALAQYYFAVDVASFGGNTPVHIRTYYKRSKHPCIPFTAILCHGTTDDSMICKPPSDAQLLEIFPEWQGRTPGTIFVGSEINLWVVSKELDWVRYTSKTVFCHPWFPDHVLRIDPVGWGKLDSIAEYQGCLDPVALAASEQVLSPP